MSIFIQSYVNSNLGNDHLTWRGGGYGFFLKKYSDFGGGKQKKFDSEFLSYDLMLSSGKKISHFAWQKKLF